MRLSGVLLIAIAAYLFAISRPSSMAPAVDRGEPVGHDVQVAEVQPTLEPLAAAHPVRAIAHTPIPEVEEIPAQRPEPSTDLEGGAVSPLDLRDAYFAVATQDEIDPSLWGENPSLEIDGRVWTYQEAFGRNRDLVALVRVVTSQMAAEVKSWEAGEQYRPSVVARIHEFAPGVIDADQGFWDLARAYDDQPSEQLIHGADIGAYRSNPLFWELRDSALALDPFALFVARFNRPSGAGD